jgi:hypothetical protein
MVGRRNVLAAAAAAFVPPGPQVAGAPPGPQVAGVPPGPQVAGVPPGPQVAGVPPGPQVAGVPPSGALRFRLRREGAAIGTHTLLFQPAAEGFVVAIAVEIAVRIGPLVLFRYQLRGSETWQSGRCIAAGSHTNDDGTATTMRAMRDPAGLWVEGTGIPRYLAPADAVVASHWNQRELRGPWINSQNGELLHPTVEPLGADPALTADGKRVPADCFAVTGPARMRLWYTPEQIWTGLLFDAKDGSRVRYERLI